MGKTTIAALMGVAVGKGLLDIDRPLIEYGVRSGANWSRNPDHIDYFPNVTTRHLLGQSSGYGKLAPGNFYTYDSYEYIMHMSYLLEAITNEAPVDFATREFVDKLGMAHEHFAYDGAIYDIGGNISVSGGQMITCLDAARIGQLIVNEGKWLDEDGSEKQLIPKQYARQIVTPSFPSRIGYGLLTWLNTQNAAHDRHANPAPRWGKDLRCNAGNKTCGRCCLNQQGEVPSIAHCDLQTDVISESAEYAKISDPNWLLRGSSMGIDSSILDDNTPANYKYERAPYDMAMAQGEWGQYMLMIPSERIVIVSMGNSGGQSHDCWEGYNEGFNNALLWNMLSPVLHKNMQYDSHAESDSYVTDDIEHITSNLGNDFVHQLSLANSSQEIVGSCMCDCPKNTGFGLCFDVDGSMGIAGVAPSDCNSTLAPSSQVKKIISNGATGLCPTYGHTLQCDFGQTTSNCGHHGFVGPHYSSTSKKLNCVQVKACGPLPNMPDDYWVETCECGLPEPGFTPCLWRPRSCSFGSYYPKWKAPSQDVVI